MFKSWVAISLSILVLTLLVWVFTLPKRPTPRSQALSAVQEFNVALQSPDPDRLLRQLALPGVLKGKTAAEQVEFVRKALTDEISDAGIEVLRREGRFGPLTELFPEQAAQWSRQAGVSAADCLAFRLEKHGIVAEVVLLKSPAPGLQDASVARSELSHVTFRVLRCNNVKQMAIPGGDT